jgi:uncharacterized protein with GYD domain
MSTYLVRFTYTPETWAKLLAKPENRRETLRPFFEAAGVTMHGLWYAFGGADGYILAEAPDGISPEATLLTAFASGSFSTVSTTCLLTVEETLEALRRGSSGYRAPGA